MNGSDKYRSFYLILLSITLLILNKQYNGPFPELVFDYFGNITAAIAAYFIIGFFARYWNMYKLISAANALILLQLFELTNGFFGIFPNRYDPLDFVANMIGVFLAFSVDSVFANFNSPRRVPFK